MDINETPLFDMSINTTGCCPKFNPDGWEEAELHFDNKRFIRAKTRSLKHVPLNMGKVNARVQEHMEASEAIAGQAQIVLSCDLSAFQGEHLFAAEKPVTGEEMAKLSGDFVTKVFEGPYSEARHWYDEMAKLALKRGKEPKDIWFFYTTCPKCANAYGKNYVVGFAQV